MMPAARHEAPSSDACRKVGSWGCNAEREGGRRTAGASMARCRQKLCALLFYLGARRWYHSMPGGKGGARDNQPNGWHADEPDEAIVAMCTWSRSAPAQSMNKEYKELGHQHVNPRAFQAGPAQHMQGQGANMPCWELGAQGIGWRTRMYRYLRHPCCQLRTPRTPPHPRHPPAPWSLPRVPYSSPRLWRSTGIKRGSYDRRAGSPAGPVERRGGASLKPRSRVGEKIRAAKGREKHGAWGWSRDGERDS